MTQITDYTSLQTAAVEYLGRDQDTVLIARVPSFIQFLEAKCNRILFVRQMEQRATALVNIASTEPEFISLPSDFQSMRRIRLSNVAGKPVLEFKTGAQIDEYRSNTGDMPGRPQFFSIVGDEMELAPTPSEAFTIEMVYRKNIPPLATNDPNWLLTLAPDLYLYGALMEAAPYMKNDERVQIWASGLTTALEDLNKLSLTSAFNSGPMSVRISGQRVV